MTDQDDNPYSTHTQEPTELTLESERRQTPTLAEIAERTKSAFPPAPTPTTGELLEKLERIDREGPMLQEALKYAKKGWHVFPVKPGGKKPMYDGGFKQATTDCDQIRKWWKVAPLANIGISLDASGLCVVDIDMHGDVNGFDSLPALGDLSAGALVRTPSGGAHYIFTATVAHHQSARPAFCRGSTC